MHQLHWHSETLRVTLVNVHAHTLPHGQRSDRTTTRGRPLARVGFALLALAFPLLATDRGRALLAAVLPRYLRQAARPRALVSSGRGGPRLPAGPG